jgi:hypothetical protein
MYYADWLVFYANFSNISAISWRDKILLLYVYTYKFLRNKTYLSIKQSDNIIWRNIKKKGKKHVFRTYAI